MERGDFDPYQDGCVSFWINRNQHNECMCQRMSQNICFVKHCKFSSTKQPENKIVKACSLSVKTDRWRYQQKDITQLYGDTCKMLKYLLFLSIAITRGHMYICICMHLSMVELLLMPNWFIFHFYIRIITVSCIFLCNYAPSKDLTWNKSDKSIFHCNSVLMILTFQKKSWNQIMLVWKSRDVAILSSSDGPIPHVISMCLKKCVSPQRCRAR